MPSLLAVDLDGTLLDRTGKPHPRDAAALRAAAAAGVHVSIVTGRLYSGTRGSAAAVGVLGPVACADGSHLVHAGTHATLLHHGLAGADAERLRAALDRHGPAAFLFAEDAIVFDAAGEPYLPYVRTWSDDVRRAGRVAEHAAWACPGGLTAAIAIGTPEQVGAAAAEVARDLGQAAQVVRFPLGRHPGLEAMLVRAAAGTKGSALGWLAAHHGVPLSETVCVGDWLNDVPMLAVAGLSFAMGHAPDEVKRAAKHVLEETAERGGGVARAVELAFGIRAD